MKSINEAIKKLKRMLIGNKSGTSVQASPTHPSKAGHQVPQGRPDQPKEIPTEVEEDGLLFLITGQTKALKKGSIHGLINYLIDTKMNDLGFIYAFLLHHPLFVKSYNLLEILIEKWKERADDRSEYAKAQVFKVANVLKFWIDNFFMDIKGDDKSVEFITEFFNMQSQDFRANGLFNMLSESVKQKLKIDNQNRKLILINPPKSFKPVAISKVAQPNAFSECGSPFVLLDFDAVELARQLTLMDFQHFQAIEAREYLDSNWKKKEKLTLSPNICKLAVWSISVSNWLIAEILNVKDITIRAATLERIISVGTELLKIKNFNSLRVVLGVVFSPCIIKLRKTLNLLPKKTRDSLEELKQLVSDKNDYQKLREKVATLTPPLIPYPELYYNDLEAYDKLGQLATVDKNDEIWVNVERMVGIAFVIKGIQNYQKARYHFEIVQEIQDHIQNYPRLSSKAAEELALKLEA